MGTKSHLTPGEFSRQFNDFLGRIVDAQGGRRTERWAEANMPKERGRSYWGKLLNGGQAMTTEDITVISGWLGVSPFEFVRAVREDDLAMVGVGGSAQNGRNVTEVDFTRGLDVLKEEMPDDLAAKDKEQGVPREDEGTDG